MTDEISMSPGLRQKIARQRQSAVLELPKTRLCGNVALALLKTNSDFDAAIDQLKFGLGNNWSHVTAIQFMSGRQAKFSAECARADEQIQLLFAHHLAEALCNTVSAGQQSFQTLKEAALHHGKEFESMIHGEQKNPSHRPGLG